MASYSSLSTKASTGSAVRRGDIKISDPLASTFTHEHLSPEQQDALHEHDLPSRVDGTWPRKSMLALHTRTGSDPCEDSDTANRHSLGPSIIMNSLSSMPSKASLSQRKPGGLRATIKRMFGSKRHRPSVTDLHDRYHPSDPGNLMAVTDLQSVTQEPTRPERPATRPNALGSHAISHSTSVENYSTQAKDEEFQAAFHKRRNTLPSLAASELAAQTLLRTNGKQKDRAQSEHKAQGDALALYNDKRRSRSVDELSKQYLSQATIIDRQDRSTTITYWRNSVMLDPLPKVADNLTEPATEAPRPKSGPQGSSTNHQSQIQPAQSFDFGLTVENEPIGLEERINTLEVKMYDFEYAIAKLQGAELSKPALPRKVSKQRSANDLHPPSSLRSRSASRSRCTSRSVSRSTASTTFTTSPSPSPLPSTENDDAFRHNRTSNVLTIRPSTSHHHATTRSNAPSPASVKLSHDQYQLLMTVIQDEKAARQQMELQLLDLQKEVELLQAPIYASIRPINLSDTNTPNHAQRAKTLHRSPPFEFNKTPAIHDVSRFSMTESEVDTIDIVDPGSPAESFATPQENRFFFESKRGSPLVHQFVTSV